MTRLATFLISLVALTSLTLLPTLVSAQNVLDVPTGETSGNCGGGDGTGLVNPLKNICSFEDLLKVILEAVVRIGFIFVTLALIWVGFKFVAAQGREEELRSAKAALLWTVIGALILLGIQAIATVIQETATSLL